MSMHRRTARNATAASAPKAKKAVLDTLQFGFKTLHPTEKDGNVAPEVDVVFVPGLGAHPQKSWESSLENNDFNWTSHKDGIQRDFPKARLLLFQYQSSWVGELKIKQFLDNIAIILLNGLLAIRDQPSRRPIVFIGHSMGGLVIAKAVTLADSRRETFPAMFECIAGCCFFGTPFSGAPAAGVASMLSFIGEKLDKANSSKLLDLMKPGNEELRELKNEFVRLVGKLNQRIELFCFYEQHRTNFAQQGGLPSVFGLLIPNSVAEIVSRDSATLTGIDSMGLPCNHRDLVKFDGPKDARYEIVREPLKRIIHGAPLVVKGRLSAVRNIDRDTIRNVQNILDGADIKKTRKTLAQKHVASSWLVNEQEYKEWLYDSSSDSARGDALWIRGQVGRGKTSNTIAVLNDLERLTRLDQDNTSGKPPPLIAYFFCDAAAELSTAEDLLKSFLHQLIDQQETLAPYAKHFVKPKSSNEMLKPTAQLTVENMWQTLHDMLWDQFMGTTVYFVINNLHILDEHSDSTEKLLGFIADEISHMRAIEKGRVPVRWLFSSRDTGNLRKVLGTRGVRLIDLEDEKYGDQVQLELRKHAHAQVSALRNEKKYDRDVAYFAHSLIGRRAQNTQWIDIACVQLRSLSQGDNRLKVRQILETMPQDLNLLLENAWNQVFNSNLVDVDKIKEMLRALVLTFEDPTASELSVLAGLSSSEQEKTELQQLIRKCKPLLTIKRQSATEVKVCFMNVVVKKHLLENSQKLLGLSEDEIKWQHGMLAFRSFSHLTQQFESASGASVDNQEDINSKSVNVVNESARQRDDMRSSWSEDFDEDNEDSDATTDDEEDNAADEHEEHEVEDEESKLIKDAALAYTVKHWLRHASRATREIAEDLTRSDEGDFWDPKSTTRRRWLIEYARLTSDFDNFDVRDLSALHVAAAVGFPHLVAALLLSGHEDELDLRDDLDHTPLHFAAYMGEVDIVEELLNRGAKIDDGIWEGNRTPLWMAAVQGNVKIMRQLINRGADINAVAKDFGPVVTSAISSGNRKAVELLINKGADLSFSSSKHPPPLYMAASWSDVPMFEYLLQEGAEKLPPEHYSFALVAAAEAGRVEAFERLLKYTHPQAAFQEALDEAAYGEEWAIVKLILDKAQNLDCDTVFYCAATTVDNQDLVLEDIWSYSQGSISKKALNEALFDATDCEKESTVRLLLQKFGANPNATGDLYGNALTAAAYDGTLNIVKMLIEKGADVNSSDGWALQMAAAEGHEDVVIELLKQGADVNACTTDTNFEPGTALQAACEAGRIKVVDLLLQHKANPDLGAGEWTCPLIAATGMREPKIAELLLKAGAKVNVVGGPERSTPLINAAALLPIRSLKLLLEAGADINLPDSEGNTPLIAAAIRGEDGSVQYLVENGADILHSNDFGYNALQVAVEVGDKSCVEILVEEVSKIMAAIKVAMDSGNESIINIVRPGSHPKSSEKSIPPVMNESHLSDRDGSPATGSPLVMKTENDVLHKLGNAEEHTEAAKSQIVTGDQPEVENETIVGSAVYSAPQDTKPQELLREETARQEIMQQETLSQDTQAREISPHESNPNQIHDGEMNSVETNIREQDGATIDPVAELSASRFDRPTSQLSPILASTEIGANDFSDQPSEASEINPTREIPTINNVSLPVVQQSPQQNQNEMKEPSIQPSQMPIKRKPHPLPTSLMPMTPNPDPGPNTYDTATKSESWTSSPAPRQPISPATSQPSAGSWDPSHRRQSTDHSVGIHRAVTVYHPVQTPFQNPETTHHQIPTYAHPVAYQQQSHPPQGDAVYRPPIMNQGISSAYVAQQNMVPYPPHITSQQPLGQYPVWGDQPQSGQMQPQFQHEANYIPNTGIVDGTQNINPMSDPAQPEQKPENRRGSSAFFGMKNTLGKAKQFGMNMRKQ